MEALILDNDKLSRKLSKTKSTLREFGEGKVCIKCFLERTRSSTEKLMTDIDKYRSSMEG